MALIMQPGWNRGNGAGGKTRPQGSPVPKSRCTLPWESDLR